MTPIVGRFAEGNRVRARRRGRRSGPTVVLMYHRVERPRHDPLRLCVTPENFAAQVAAIRTVAEIVAPHAIFEPGDGPRVALTFDDGYADNLHHAAPVLEAHGAPACIFVTNHYLPESPEFWWDQLDHLFLDDEAGPPFLDLELGGRRVRFDLRSQAGRIRTFARLNVVLREMSDDARQVKIDEVHHELGRTPVRCAGHQRLRADQLRALAAGGLVTIGGHTTSHAALTRIDETMACAEITDNRRALAAITGQEPRLFAYPYGLYRRRNLRAVRAAGYSMAFLARADPIGALTSPYAVPRLPMKDWTGDELLRELQLAFAG